MPSVSKALAVARARYWASAVTCARVKLFIVPSMAEVTAVRLKVEQNQLVGVFGKIGIQVNALKGA